MSTLQRAACTVVVVVATCMAGCNEPVDSFACTDVSDPIAEILQVSMGAAGATLRGTVASDRLVSRVSVLGVPVTRVSGDFDEWMVVLLADVLEAQDSNPVEASVLVQSVCEEVPTERATTSIQLPTGEGLSLVVSGPDFCYLPTNGADVATASLCAPSEAAGLIVSVAAFNATLEQFPAAPVLAAVPDPACGDGEVSATSFVRATNPGRVRITASAAGAVPVEAELSAAGAPTLQPAALSVPAGESRSSLLFTAGTLDVCTVSSNSPELSVAVDTESFGDELDFAVSPDCASWEPDGTRELVVSADAGARAGQLTVVCWDVYGQSATVTASVAPAG